MEQFLTPKLEQNLSEISLEYVYKKELIFPDCPGFVKRNIISKSPAGHEDILASWMTKGYIPDDYEAWHHVMRREPLPANMRFSELGDLIVHISKKEDSPFNILYCPEKMQDFQKWRVRIWWEYFTKRYLHENSCQKVLQRRIQIILFFMEHFYLFLSNAL